MQASLWSLLLGDSTGKWSRIGALPVHLDIPRWEIDSSPSGDYRILATRPGSSGSGLVLTEPSGTQFVLTESDLLGVYTNPRFAKQGEKTGAIRITSVEASSESPEMVMFCRNGRAPYRQCARQDVEGPEALLDVLWLESPWGTFLLHQHRLTGESERTDSAGERILPGSLLLTRIGQDLSPKSEAVSPFPEELIYEWDAVMDSKRLHIFASTAQGGLHATLACNSSAPVVIARFPAHEQYQLSSPTLLLRGDDLFFAAITAKGTETPQLLVGEVRWDDL